MREDGTVMRERKGAAWGGAKAKQQIGLCILRTACGKRPMHGMKLDVINGVHQGLIFPAWRLVLPMAPKRIVFPENRGSQKDQKGKRTGLYS